MIKVGLVSFAVEFAGLSAVYSWIIFCLIQKVWYQQYHMLLALGTTLSGFLTATVPFLIDLIYRVDWELALWVSNINKSF